MFSLSVLVAFHHYMRLHKVLVSKDQGVTNRPKAVWYLPAAPVNESGLTTADTEYGGVFMRRLLNPLCQCSKVCRYPFVLRVCHFHFLMRRRRLPMTALNRYRYSLLNF